MHSWTSPHQGPTPGAGWTPPDVRVGMEIFQNGTQIISSKFSKKNFEHYLRIRGFIFWNYQHIIRLLSSGKNLNDIYVDFMNATNLLDLPSKTHHDLVNKSLKIIKDFQLPG